MNGKRLERIEAMAGIDRPKCPTCDRALYPPDVVEIVCVSRIEAEKVLALLSEGELRTLQKVHHQLRELPRE